MQYNNKPIVLLVDDDTALLETAQMLLQDSFDILLASSVSQAKNIVRNQAVAVAVVDLHFEGQEHDGLELIDWASDACPSLPIIVFSGDRNTERVVAATHRKLVAFVTKPSSGQYERSLRMAIAKGLDLKKRHDEMGKRATFETRSPKLRAVVNQIEMIANSGTDCSILINGETGTGKGMLVKYYAALVKKTLVSANMANIPKDMAESELFGHEKGSFTGAVGYKPGLMLQANNGIFFLDEIGECPLPVQAKLLRVLEDGEIRPVGSVTSKRINTQFIAATHRDLTQHAELGTFRLDLLHRISTVTLLLPALRERPEDIELYANLFLEEYQGDRPFTVRASGLDALMSHSWRGNVRELENLIQKICILSPKRELDGDTVMKAIDEKQMTASPGGDSFGIRTNVLKALERAGGNREKAAQILNVHRSTLFRWIKEFGIGASFKGKHGRPTLGPIGG